MWLRVKLPGIGHSICKASLRWSKLTEQANSYPSAVSGCTAIQPYTIIYKVYIFFLKKDSYLDLLYSGGLQNVIMC